VVSFPRLAAELARGLSDFSASITVSKLSGYSGYETASKLSEL
jgi:hypothetical protein